MSIISATPSGVAAQQQLILRAWRSMLGDRRVIYLSGPINTGFRRVLALEKGAVLGNQDNVFIENIRAIERAARELRGSNPAEIIVEPASFTADGWSQDDYLRLWIALIEHHAREVRFLPDWQYSIGCAKEFAHAATLRVPTFTMDGMPLSLESGMKLLGNALHDLAMRCHRTPALASLAQVLEEVFGRLAGNYD
jgi:hypothetical protein